MRDGILASVATAPDDPGDACRVWSAFAQFGVGVGASGAARGPSTVITESFIVPAGLHALKGAAGGGRICLCAGPVARALVTVTCRPRPRRTVLPGG